MEKLKVIGNIALVDEIEAEVDRNLESWRDNSQSKSFISKIKGNCHECGFTMICGTKCWKVKEQHFRKWVSEVLTLRWIIDMKNEN